MTLEIGKFYWVQLPGVRGQRVAKITAQTDKTVSLSVRTGAQRGAAHVIGIRSYSSVFLSEAIARRCGKCPNCTRLNGLPKADQAAARSTLRCPFITYIVAK